MGGSPWASARANGVPRQNARIFSVLRSECEAPLVCLSGTLASSAQVEAIEVHYFGPGRDEVAYELFVRVGAAIDLRYGSQHGARAEDEIDTGSGPLELVGFPITPFERISGGLPAGVHVQQIDEEVIGQRGRRLREDTIQRLSRIGAEHAQATDQHGQLGRGQRQ